MLLYTSSAGRLGMLVFARVKKAIFSLETQQQEEPGGLDRRGDSKGAACHDWDCSLT